MKNLHKISMPRGGLLYKHFSKRFVQIPAMTLQLKPIFIFPIISLWKLYVAIATKVLKQRQKKKKKKKKQQQKTNLNSFVEAHAMNISAKFRLYPPYSFWGVVFYAPNFEEVEGAYWFGPLRACVCPSVTLCIRSRTVRDRILKFDMWN